MKNTPELPIPVLKALHKLGKDLNDARRRRRITLKLMAERAGVSRATLGKIERGDPTTSIGAYSAVFFVLGMIDRLNDLMDVVHDRMGLSLEEEKLPQRVRLPNHKKRDVLHE